jgi:hypothetical protein
MFINRALAGNFNDAQNIHCCNMVLMTRITPLKLSGNYMNYLLKELETIHFVFTGFVRFSLGTVIQTLTSVKKLICVMEKCRVFFAVRTELSNII